MACIEPNGIALALFATAFGAWCLSFFTLAGMFPQSARPQSVLSAAGSALILLNAGLLIVLLTGVALFAQQMLRWSTAIMFGGLIILFVPAVFQVIPSAWRDSRSGLAALSLVQIASLALLFSPLHGLPLS